MEQQSNYVVDTPFRLSVRLRGRFGRLSLMLAGLVMAMGWFVPSALAQQTITTITDCSSDAALRTAIGNGGIINFNCGTTTINLSSSLTVARSVTIDGGGKITINGNGNRIFDVSIGQFLSVQNITLTGGNADRGGAIRVNSATVWVINSTLTSNSCTATDDNSGCGGAIYVTGAGATLNVVKSNLNNNTATNGEGGAIAVLNGTVKVIRSTLSNNTAKKGGGIGNLKGKVTVSYSTVSNNNGSEQGGAFFANEAPSTVIEGTTIDGNTSTRGGVMMTSGADANSNQVTIRNSTLSNNQATDTNTPGALDMNEVTLVITNSTLAQNKGQNPGAIRINENTTVATIRYSTIAFNESTASPKLIGGIQKRSGTSSLSLQGVIIASNTDRNCGPDGISLNNVSNNLQFSDATCADLQEQNPNITFLQSDGGDTQTIPVSAGSPAVNANGTNCPTTDQRGYLRNDGSCDIGAYELNASAPPAPTLTSIISKTATGGNPVYDLTVSGTNFTEASVVNWNGQPLPTVYISDTELRAFVPIDDMNNVSIVPITVDGSDPKNFTASGVGALPEGVTITGPTSGEITVGYNFTATITPTAVTQTVTYNWQATDQAAISDTSILNNVQNFSWGTAGQKVITVTASLKGQTVTDTHVFTINTPVAPSGLDTTNSPTTGTTGVQTNFNVSVQPLTATQPITYIWQATDQQTITQTNGGSTSQVPFTWTEPGLKFITVTVQNVLTTFTQSFTVTIEAATTTTPPAGVIIAGPIVGQTGQVYSFTAAVNPDTTSQPLTYIWQATDQTQQLNALRGLTDQITFTWNTTGTKTITVTANNAAGNVDDTHTIVIEEAKGTVPPTDVTLTGPTSGETGMAYIFTATVGVSTTLPVTYTWQATDQIIISRPADNQNDVISFTWMTSGTKLITVTAQNAFGEATASQSIVIEVSPSMMPPTDVTLTGPTTGETGLAYHFTATVGLSTTLPVTYTWQATDQTIISRPGGGQSDVISFTWATSGTKTITVTAENAFGEAMATRAIVIEVAVTGTPPTEVMIDGIMAGGLNTGYQFRATVNPDGTTQPLTYTWQATDQTSVIHVKGPSGRLSAAQTGLLSDTVPFTWTTEGDKLITVTVENAYGAVTDVHSATIVAQPLAVTINGPTMGLIRQAYVFSATIEPLTATQPITYSWFPEPDAGQGTAVVTYSWPLTGTQVITIGAANLGGVVTDSHVIMIDLPRIYLPVVFKEE